MKTLERTLGLSAVISVSISSMLGSGIFVLPGVAFAQTGPSTYLAYMLAALCVLPAAMSKSELATAMPTSGGTYVYLERTFGPLVGTVAGLGLWLSLLLKSAFALIGIGAYLSVITHWPLIPTVEMVLLGIVLLNLFGVGKVSKSIIVVVVLCILGLLTLIGLGFVKAEQGHMEPFMTEGVEGFFAATALVFVSYAGVTKVAAIAEEVKSPERNLPRGILVSLAIVSILYALVSYVLGLLFPQAAIADNLKPIHTMAQYLGGEVLGVVIAVLAILTMASMANAGLLAASRFPFAMARDRLLPYFVGRLHQRFLTPVWSIIFSGIVVAASVFTLDVGKIAKLASAFILLIYLMENIAVIVLRELRVQWYKPKYKSPLYPWVQIFGVLSTGVLLLSMKSLVVVAILTIGVPGLLIYFLYAQSIESNIADTAHSDMGMIIQMQEQLCLGVAVTNNHTITSMVDFLRTGSNPDMSNFTLGNYGDAQMDIIREDNWLDTDTTKIRFRGNGKLIEAMQVNMARQTGIFACTNTSDKVTTSLQIPTMSSSEYRSKALNSFIGSVREDADLLADFVDRLD